MPTTKINNKSRSVRDGIIVADTITPENIGREFLEVLDEEDKAFIEKYGTKAKFSKESKRKIREIEKDEPYRYSPDELAREDASLTDDDINEAYELSKRELLDELAKEILDLTKPDYAIRLRDNLSYTDVKKLARKVGKVISKANGIV